MTTVRLIFLLVIIAMMNRYGIIYRGAEKKRNAGLDLENSDIDTSPRDKGLSGSWRLSEVSEFSPDTDEEGFLTDKKVTDKHQLLLSFFPDSSFTRIKSDGSFESGRWVYDDSTGSVFLTIKRKTEEVNVFFDVAANDRRQITFEFSPQVSLSMVEFGTGIPRFREDPFYAANNRWRTKPAQSESEKQILARLLNYIAHNAYILKTAQIRKQDYVSWEFSKGIIKIYKSGIGIVRPENIPAEWIDVFYSKENALQAHAIFEKYLRKKTYKGKATKDWVRDDYAILSSIHNGLKQQMAKTR
ncbi:hypothetical protein [Dyadobacter bucti]|uniref:hypothetical protein n=1 Tax=Dyadobacter bucti TaxID=2572203 RepID=UPI003F6E7CF1